MVSTFTGAQPVLEPGRAGLCGFELKGPEGQLEALLNEGRPNAPYAAVICHPHPQGGGTMHNKVVYHAMKALNAPEWGLGWPVLRFNFRGVGLSDGKHDGKAEAGDVRAAIGWLESEYKRPLVVVGFSFGAAMALSACCHQTVGQGTPDSVRAVVALGLPTRTQKHAYQYSFLVGCSLPKLFLSGERDEFAPVADLQSVAATTAEPKKLVLLPGADHFFAGQLEAMQNALARWLLEQLK